MKIFAMLSFLEFAINFFACVVKVEKIKIFKRKRNEFKFCPNLMHMKLRSLQNNLTSKKVTGWSRMTSRSLECEM